MWQEISKIGKKLVRNGLTSAHFGNISIRRKNKILITATGNLLDELDKRNIAEVDLKKTPPASASAETIVHQRIYQTLPVSAIIHTHSPFAVILSMVSSVDHDHRQEEMLILEDCESKYFLKEIPIVSGEPGTEELANKCAKALKNRRAVIVQGHGTFAVGKNLTEAYLIISSLEQACKIKYFTDLYSFTKVKLDSSPR